MTNFSSRCNILAELWIDYRQDENFTDFIEYNDLGLPLAYSISEGLATPNEQGIKYINETFDLLLEALGKEDEGFETLEDVFNSIEE